MMSHGQRLAARFFRLPPQLDEFADYDIAMIALNFNDPLAHGAPRAAALLEARRQSVDFRERQRQTAYRRHALAGSAFDFPPHAYGARAGRPRGSFGTYAVANRSTAIRAQAPNAGGIDNSSSHAAIMPI